MRPPKKPYNRSMGKKVGLFSDMVKSFKEGYGSKNKDEPVKIDLTDTFSQDELKKLREMMKEHQKRKGQ